MGRSLEKGILPGDSQYSCLANSMNRGAWLPIVHGVPKSLTQMSDEHIHTHWSWALQNLAQTGPRQKKKYWVTKSWRLTWRQRIPSLFFFFSFSSSPSSFVSSLSLSPPSLSLSCLSFHSTNSASVFVSEVPTVSNCKKSQEKVLSQQSK